MRTETSDGNKQMTEEDRRRRSSSPYRGVSEGPTAFGVGGRSEGPKRGFQFGLRLRYHFSYPTINHNAHTH